MLCIEQEGYMTVNLKGRSFLTLMDFTPEEIRYLIDLSHELKAKKKSGTIGHLLEGKTIPADKAFASMRRDYGI